jgi:hypothetical protein
MVRTVWTKLVLFIWTSFAVPALLLEEDVLALPQAATATVIVLKSKSNTASNFFDIGLSSFHIFM